MRGELKRGWTTGTCAAAATHAAVTALHTGTFTDPVEIALPRGQRATLALAERSLAPGVASAAIVKDAGDDPDVTHGCLVRAIVRRGEPGSGVTFRAGEGVGTVTRAGLPIPPGEPAINPTPRAMIRGEIEALARTIGSPLDLIVEIAIPGGEAIALKTLNPRLGIVGGLSILGTTGIVVPFSCAAWIHSIHRGIDVARAAGLEHVAAATGSTSEAVAKRHLGLDEMALIDMGDFVGGTLRYLRRHPVPKVTLAGGFAKLAKLAQGAMDLHNTRSTLDRADLAARLARLGASAALVERVGGANTAAEVLALAEAEGLPVGRHVAEAARDVAQAAVGDGCRIAVLVVDRGARIVGSADAT